MKPKPSPPKNRLPSWALDYLKQSRRPLASLALVLPLLLAYEGGVLLLGPQAVRNGADVWLRQFLDLLGFGQYFFLPALAVAVLLGWHHMLHDRWRISPGVLYVMFAECCLLGLILLLVGRAEGLLAQKISAAALADDARLAVGSLTGARVPLIGRVLGFLGAGVYEELLFRLLLLPPVLFFAERFGARRAGLRVTVAVVLTSLAFAAAHYVGSQGEVFESFGFAFRFTAGAFFALLFVYRGFGIAACTHALYDIFVSLG